MFEKEVPTHVVEMIDSLFYIIFGIFPSSRHLFKTEEELLQTKLCWANGLESFRIIDSNDNVDLDAYSSAFIGILTLDQQHMPTFGQFLNFCLDRQGSKSKTRKNVKKSLAR